VVEIIKCGEEVDPSAVVRGTRNNSLYMKQVIQKPEFIHASIVKSGRRIIIIQIIFGKIPFATTGLECRPDEAVRTGM
jgi:hypothetical protein